MSHRPDLRPVGRFPVAYLEPVSRTGIKLVSKRVFDVVVSTIGLVIFAPVMLISAVAIRVRPQGPVIFRQALVGKDGKRFTMLKFRTTIAEAEDDLEELCREAQIDGRLFKLANDPGVTRVGRALRRTWLDEIPQLINVIKGDMSELMDGCGSGRESPGCGRFWAEARSASRSTRAWTSTTWTIGRLAATWQFWRAPRRRSCAQRGLTKQ